MAPGTNVVVVGGGVRGTSIGYYLARAGIGVTLLEKGFLASGASGANAGLVNVSGKTPEHYTAFSLLSGDMYPAFVAELGVEVDYQRDGYLRVAEDDADAEVLARHAERQSAVPGVTVEVLDARSARSLEPAPSPRLSAAAFCAQDGNVDPFKLTLALGRRTAAWGRDPPPLRGNGHPAPRRTHRRRGHVPGRSRRTSWWMRLGSSCRHRAHGRRPGARPSPARPDGPARASCHPCSRPIDAMRQVRSGTTMVGTTQEFVGQDRSVTYAACLRMVARARRVAGTGHGPCHPRLAGSPAHVAGWPADLRRGARGPGVLRRRRPQRCDPGAHHGPGVLDHRHRAHRPSHRAVWPGAVSPPRTSTGCASQSRGSRRTDAGPVGLG